MSLGTAAAAVLAAATLGGGDPSPAPNAQSLVTSYPAAFFAPGQPTTALDMVQRLPGFTLDTGDAVRGFGGAAGNVLANVVKRQAIGGRVVSQFEIRHR